MSRFFRTWGLLAFAILIAAFSVTWIIFADNLVRRSVESSAEVLLETKVDIGKASVNLLPLSVSLEKIQIADKNDKSTNQAEVDEISFAMDINSLLERKVIIEEMRMKGLRFGAERAPEDIATDSEPRTKLSAPEIDLPSIQEILEKENIQSYRMVEKSITETRAEIVSIKMKIDALPDQTALTTHKQNTHDLATKIKSKGLVGVLTYAQDIVDLKSDIAKDIELYKATQRDIEVLADQIKNDKKAIRTQVQNDVNSIKSRYGSIQQAAFSFSEALFGLEFRKRLETGLVWYNRLEPVIGWAAKRIINGLEIVEKPGSRGINVRFQEKHPKPDFYIGTIDLELENRLGVLAGQVNHVTADQHITKLPVKFTFSGEELKSANRVFCNGEINRIDPENINDVAAFEIDGLLIEQLSVLTAEGVAIRLNSGLADISGTINNDGDQLSGQIDMQFTNTRFSSWLPEGKGGAVGLQRLLDSISDFQLSAKLSGSTERWSMRINSDLDAKFSDYFSAIVGNEVQKFENDLKAGIESELANKMSNLDIVKEELEMFITQLNIGINDREDIISALLF